MAKEPDQKQMFQALNKIIGHELPSTPKYLLLLLAHHGEWRNGTIEHIFPGEQLLARLSGFHETTVRRWMGWLKREEYLVLDGRKSNGRYSHVEQYVIFEARFEPGYEKGGLVEQEKKPRSPRKAKLQPTDEEPRVPPNFRTPEPEPPPAAPEPPALQPITFDAEYLRNQRKTILGLLKRARAGEPAAMHWWESSGQNSMARLETINQMLGLDAEIEENEGVPV